MSVFPSNWSISSLEDCLEALIDYRGKTPKKSASGVPLLSAKVIKGGRILDEIFEFLPVEDYDIWMRRGLPRAGDIVMTTEGPLGEIAQLDHRKYALGQRIVTLRGKQGLLDNNYLKFIMQSAFIQDQLFARSSGTTVLGIKQSELRKIKIPFPPLPEQRAIAEILGSLDDKIEANRRENETLEATARAIFKSWFVDFDPVHAKARGEHPAGMDAETAALFPDSFEDSALGLIPRGWQVGRLDEFCKIARGSSPRPINDYMNGTTPWVKIADATAANGPFIFETKEKLKESGVSKSVFLKRGSLILSNSATAGIPIFLEIDGCIHDGWLYFPDLTSFSQNYLYHVLLTISNHLISIADGTVQKNLNTKLVGSQFILLPTDDLLAKFDEITVSLINKVKSNSIESRTLAETRDVLLPRLVSGELRVGDVGDIS